MQPDYSIFRQIDYYWLFDKKMKFSKRPGFSLYDDLCVTEYLKMAKINRRNLTKFLKRVMRNKKSVITNAESFDSMSTDKDYFKEEEKQKEKKENIFSDRVIDEEFKVMLKDRRYGQILPLDIVAHLQYFYNTLNFAHAVNTDNPFKNPKEYPALLYEDGLSPGTLLDKNMKLIFPSSEQSEGKDSLLSISPPPQYKWYPNPTIKSPMCSSPLIDSPGPKSSVISSP